MTNAIITATGPHHSGCIGIDGSFTMLGGSLHGQEPKLTAYKPEAFGESKLASADIGEEHVVARTEDGEVFWWGRHTKLVG